VSMRPPTAKATRTVSRSGVQVHRQLFRSESSPPIPRGSHRV
jgi:hypothetical protein